MNFKFSLPAQVSGIAVKAALCTALIISGCATRSVTRVEPDKQIDLSGRWNDTDSRNVATDMVKDVLARRWRSDFVSRYAKNPVVIVGIIQNKSNEHIDSETFIQDIQKEFINSGMVRVVENSVLREAIRKERGDQAQFASVETQAKFGKELGANFMLFGTITSTEDAQGKRRVIDYKVSLHLSDMETNEIVWLNSSEQKKYIVN
ncbi:MAG: penicillin-binding protein activator LpoB [Bacteroidota bacterium]